jgi:hypothetical protein
MIMRLSWAESEKHLKEHNVNISRRRFYEIKKEILESRHERLAYIAKQGFVDQHLERIGNVEMINQEMWKCYRAKDYQAMEALVMISNLQPLIADFYGASQDMMEHEIKIRPKEDNEEEDKDDQEQTDPEVQGLPQAG